MVRGRGGEAGREPGQQGRERGGGGGGRGEEGEGRGVGHRWVGEGSGGTT